MSRRSDKQKRSHHARFRVWKKMELRIQDGSVFAAFCSWAFITPDPLSFFWVCFKMIKIDAHGRQLGKTENFKEKKIYIYPQTTMVFIFVLFLLEYFRYFQIHTSDGMWIRPQTLILFIVIA